MANRSMSEVMSDEQRARQLDLDAFRAGQGTLSLHEKKKEEPTDLISVTKMVYWDGSKFIIRTDKPGWKKILCKLRVKMRSRFLALPKKEQIEIAQSGGMVNRIEEMMSEEQYLKIEKG